MTFSSLSGFSKANLLHSPDELLTSPLLSWSAPTLLADVLVLNQLLYRKYVSLYVLNSISKDHLLCLIAGQSFVILLRIQGTFVRMCWSLKSFSLNSLMIFAEETVQEVLVSVFLCVSLLIEMYRISSKLLSGQIRAPISPFAKFSHGRSRAIEKCIITQFLSSRLRLQKIKELLSLHFISLCYQTMWIISESFVIDFDVLCRQTEVVHIVSRRHAFLEADL